MNPTEKNTAKVVASSTPYSPYNAPSSPSVPSPPPSAPSTPSSPYSPPNTPGTPSSPYSPPSAPSSPYSSPSAPTVPSSPYNPPASPYSPPSSPYSLPSSPYDLPSSPYRPPVIPYAPPLPPQLRIHTVTLNANGGSVSPTSIDVPHGESIASVRELPDAVWINRNAAQAFSGWRTTTGALVDVNQPIQGDMSLGANWTPPPLITAPLSFAEVDPNEDLAVIWRMESEIGYSVSVRNVTRDVNVTGNSSNPPGHFVIQRHYLTPGDTFEITVSFRFGTAQPVSSTRRFTVRRDFISPYGNIRPTLTSPFAFRQGNRAELHAALDMAAGEGTPILAIGAGEVIANRTGSVVGEGSGYGYHVIIRHTHPTLGTFCALYAHLQAPSPFSVGDPVTQGQVIGREGRSSGLFDADGRPQLFGSHLHFQTWLGPEIDYSSHVAFNPLDLYNIVQTREGISQSTLMSMATGANAYSWNWTFIRNHPRGTGVLNDPARLNDTLAFLRSIDAARVAGYTS